MYARVIAFAAFAVAGCATPYDEQEVEAVRDYIAAAELEEVDQIRLYNQMSYRYVNDYFVTIPTRRGDYLVEFAQRCAELRRTEFTSQMVDRRDNSNLIRSGFDTIRGCRIGRIYTITELQRVELHDLGDAPGEEVYLPDDEEPN